MVSSLEPPPTNTTKTDRKRKATGVLVVAPPEPVVVVSSSSSSSSSTAALDERRRPRDTTRPRGVSTDAASTACRTPGAAQKNKPNHAAAVLVPSTTAIVVVGSVERIGKLIQDLSSPDGILIEASLNKLGRDVFHADRGSQILQEIVAVGGCFALVQLAKTLLEKKARMGGIRTCDQVTTELTGLDVTRRILRDSLRIVAALTFKHPVSKDIISSIGGVEAVVKVMQTFPKCEDLQSAACNVLCNLTTTFVGAEKASKVETIKVLLTTIKRYPENKYIFRVGCNALVTMCESSSSSSFKQTKLLIDLGGITAWPDDPDARAAAKRVLQVMARGTHFLLNTY